MTFKVYCKEHKMVLFYQAILVVIFFSIFGLYHLPMKAVCYPVLLSVVVGVCFLLSDYGKWKRHCNEVERLKTVYLEGMHVFPDACYHVEEFYQELVRILTDQLDDHSIISNEKYEQMMEYYTMWVHQIKTPISSMKLTLENMDSAEARKLMVELRRIEQYVNMVLTYLRLDSESSDFVFKEYSLDELIKPVIRKLSTEFIGRKLSLSYEAITDCIVTDEKWFAFVLEQVLSNALKYTKTGGIHIYEENAFLVIEDTGIGIAAEDIPRIFEKGFTGANGRKDQKASGIGLFLCKKVCDRLKLPIQAESEVSKGTRILIGMKQDLLNVRE